MIKAVIYSPEKPLEPISRVMEEFPQVTYQACRDIQGLNAHLEDGEVFITFPCTAEMVAKAPKLRWIQALKAGVDNFPLDMIKKRGIILTNGKGIHGGHMAEYAICAMIMLARNFPFFIRCQALKKWDRSVEHEEISGATVGILGMGEIGREVAKKASLMGMRVLGVKKNPANIEWVDELYSPDKMGEIFKKSDYIVNLLPHTKETEKIIDKRFFDLVKPGTGFINIGRGKTVNEDDLLDALKEKKIKAMVSDVFYEEPLPGSHPFWEMENVFITPHICGESVHYMTKAADLVRHNLRAYLEGKDGMRNIVDWEKGY